MGRRGEGWWSSEAASEQKCKEGRGCVEGGYGRTCGLRCAIGDGRTIGGYNGVTTIGVRAADRCLGQGGGGGGMYTYMQAKQSGATMARHAVSRQHRHRRGREQDIKTEAKGQKKAVVFDEPGRRWEQGLTQQKKKGHYIYSGRGRQAPAARLRVERRVRAWFPARNPPMARARDSPIPAAPVSASRKDTHGCVHLTRLGIPSCFNLVSSPRRASATARPPTRPRTRPLRPRPPACATRCGSVQPAFRTACLTCRHSQASASCHYVSLSIPRLAASTYSSQLQPTPANSSQLLPTLPPPAHARRHALVLSNVFWSILGSPPPPPNRPVCPRRSTRVRPVLHHGALQDAKG